MINLDNIRKRRLDQLQKDVSENFAQRKVEADYFRDAYKDARKKMKKYVKRVQQFDEEYDKIIDYAILEIKRIEQQVSEEAKKTADSISSDYQAEKILR